MSLQQRKEWEQLREYGEICEVIWKFQKKLEEALKPFEKQFNPVNIRDLCSKVIFNLLSNALEDEGILSATLLSLGKTETEAEMVIIKLREKELSNCAATHQKRPRSFFFLIN